jgi:hypothetical protein
MAAPPEQEFTPQPDDPLALEHAAVNRWLQDAIQSSKPKRYWRDIDLKSLEGGRLLLAATPEQARRLVLAALAQMRNWDEQIEHLRGGATTDIERAHPHLLLNRGQLLWCRHTVAAIGALIRRSLPLEKGDVMSLLTWCIGLPQLNLYHAPVAHVTKALQRYAATNVVDSELRDVMRKFAASLRSAYRKEGKRLGTIVEQLCQDADADIVPEQRTVIVNSSPKPSSVGRPLVLYQLKCFLGIAHADPDLITIQVGPDRFNMPAESPLCNEHEKLTELFDEIAGSQSYYDPDLRMFSAGRAILGFDPILRGRVLLAAAERNIVALLAATPDYNDTRLYRSRYAAAAIARTLASSPVQLDRDGLFDFLLYRSTRPPHERMSDDSDKALFAGIQAVTDKGASLMEGERFVLHLWRGGRIGGPPLGVSSPDVERLTRWIGDGAQFYLAPGECWSDAVNADIAGSPAAMRSKWTALLKHLLNATAARPSDKWRNTAIQQMKTIGASDVRQSLDRWLPLVAKGRTLLKTAAFVGDTRTTGDSIHDENATALRGLLWLVPLLPRCEGLSRLVASVALSAYRKIPGVGPRAVKVGNAAVYALSEMVSPEAIGQLAMLKVRVRFGTAQKEIEKAFDAAAAALELPRDQIEEMSVPACGLESVGRRDETIGEYRTELIVTGSAADLRWFDGRGKLLNSVPSSVKRDNADTLKDLQQSLKDVVAMLSAQRDRIDALFLERKSWLEPVWRERYLNHPLVGTIARRLIWCIGDTPVTVADGQAVGIHGKPVEAPDGAVVTLWHPAGRSIDEIVAWRRRIEALGIVQPFKQAHREVYLPTDAERRTSTYSNRFAAHILRQHQFNALCGARRWKNRLRLMVDDTYPPASRVLPAWGLRAEFWIEGIGTDYGLDTNDSGVFLRLASDQVRFYRIAAASNVAHAGGGGYTADAQGPGRESINEPLSPDEVPPLVFSEIMRDVDLFVGVASIGNDPMWQDGGPGGRYRDYWQTYSFGDLSATAVTRREALQRLVPRLKIADRCTFNDRFLIVRGEIRTYKIHLGSGNILMEPNDQYLCIVPDSRVRSHDSEAYIPFEGDLTLSIILSKAFLLVQDSKIKDSTINRQIDGR